MVDGAESELGILDLIQVFVESLDRTFENVCELDLIFHFDEVHLVLAEIIQGGLVLETNLSEIASCGEYRWIRTRSLRILWLKLRLAQNLQSVKRERCGRLRSIRTTPSPSCPTSVVEDEGRAVQQATTLEMLRTAGFLGWA